MRRVRTRLRRLLPLSALVCAACSAPLPGQPQPTPAPATSTVESLAQALTDLSESGVVRYRGTMTAPSGDPVGLDVAVTPAGEVTGSMTVHDKRATVLVVDRTLYLKADADFWTGLSGIPDSAAPAIAGRWTQLPGAVLGVDPGLLLAPAALSVSIGGTANTRPLAEGPLEKIGNIDAIRVDTAGGSVHLAARPPHGVLRVQLRNAGSSDLTRVRELSVDVTDATTQLASVYQELAGRGPELAEAVDPFTDIREGGHRFDACGPAGCAIIVEFSSQAEAPIRVAVTANWTGDGRPLGSCQAIAGPVYKGQNAGATCTISTPDWAAFYQRAHTVPGEHPYDASWSAVAVANPPDLGGILRARDAIAATPDQAAGPPGGTHHVYVIRDVRGTVDRGVWKYGVADGPAWRETTTRQLSHCHATTRSACAADLVSSADNAATAHSWMQRLVESYRGRNGHCPLAQWVGCPG
jgi:hypothetical protein